MLPTLQHISSMDQVSFIVFLIPMYLCAPQSNSIQLPLIGLNLAVFLSGLGCFSQLQGNNQLPDWKHLCELLKIHSNHRHCTRNLMVEFINKHQHRNNDSKHPTSPFIRERYNGQKNPKTCSSSKLLRGLRLFTSPK